MISDFLRRVRTSVRYFIFGYRGTEAYWEKRYREGRNSGSGSYGAKCAAKADFVNRFVAEHDIKSVIDFGCGDGNQLKHARYPLYLGLDISGKSVQICTALFAGDESKSFKPVSAYDGDYAELAISLDVIFHLVEDDIYSEYMHRLFDSAVCFVIIHAPDSDDNRWGQAMHIKSRKFTRWIAKNKPTWQLCKHEKPEDADDFFVYSRMRVLSALGDESAPAQTP